MFFLRPQISISHSLSFAGLNIKITSILTLKKPLDKHIQLLCTLPTLSLLPKIQSLKVPILYSFYR